MTTAPFPSALIKGRVYHKPSGANYADHCNREAMRDASRSRKDYEGFDVDINVDADGCPWCHHQLHPTKRDGWRDPRGKIQDRHDCRTLHTPEMNRLVTDYQGHPRPILNMREAAIFLHNLRPRPLIPCFELKFMHRQYFDDNWWEWVRNWIPLRTRSTIMSLPGGHGGQDGLRKLAHAHEAGFTTMWLWRDGPPPTGYQKHVDLIKSRPGHPIYRV